MMGPERFELSTNGLKGRCGSFSNQDITSQNGPNLVHAKIHEKVHTPTPSVALAKSILTLASARQQVPVELLHLLASNVLAAVPVQLAQAILEGGDYALDRAIELAEMLSQEGAETSTMMKGGAR